MASKIQRAYNEYQSGMNEGGEGYNPHSRALAAEYAAEDARKEAEFQAFCVAEKVRKEAEWTLALTTQRRAAWNAWVRSASTGGKLAPLKVAQQIKAQGWSVEELKAAIVRHGL